MADRYWVGGTGTWNTTSTTVWSASSGGPSGASVPTAADNVFFDSATTYTVTMTGALACLDITVSAGTVTFATGTTPTLAVTGSMSLSTGTVWNSTGTITFNATTTGKTITTNGISLGNCPVVLNGVGGAWSLGSAFTSTSSVTLTNGTFDANNYNFTAGSFLSTSTNVRSLTLGTGTWTITSMNLAASANAASVNLTLNTTNSSVVITTTLNTGRNNFNNLTTSAGNATLTVQGPCSFNTITVAGAPSGTGAALRFYAGSSFTVSNLVNSRTRCSLVSSDTAGTRATIALASGTLSPRYFAFKDITFAGPGTWTTSIFNFCFDAGNNTGTTFESAYYYISTLSAWSVIGSWSNTFGGTSNGAIPDSTTNVVIEPNSITSSSRTITIPTGSTCNSLIMVAKTTTIIVSSYAVTVSGSIYIGESGLTLTNVGTVTLNSTATGNIIYVPISTGINLTINGVGGEWSLGANYSSFAITLTAGTFKTNNYSLTLSTFSSSNSNVRAAYLGSSIVTLTTLTASTLTNLTFDSGTSTISVSGTLTLSDATPLTVYNLTIPSRATVGVSTLAMVGTIIVSNLFNLQASSDITFRRAIVSNRTGVPVTFVCNSVNAGWANVDFSDVVISGAAVSGGPISGTNLGNRGGNTNIVFRDPLPRFWNLPAGGNWSSVAWAANSGSTPDAAYFPLPQDIPYIESTGLDSGATITIDASWGISGIDLSSRTSNTMTLAIGSSSTLRILGNWVSGSGVVLSGIGTILFEARTPSTIQSNGVPFTQQTIQINSSTSTTVSLLDALTCASFSILHGNFNLNGLTLTCSTATTVVVNGGIPNLIFNSGTLAITGSQFTNNAGTNFTTTAGTGPGIIRMLSGSAKTFSGAGVTYNCTLSNAGAGALTISGNNTFTALANEVTPATFTFTAGTTTTVTNWNIAGTAGNLVTIGSTTSSQATLSKSSGVVSTDYLSISNSNATGGAQWFPGANSVNGVNNSGWLFSPGFFMQLFY